MSSQHPANSSMAHTLAPIIAMGATWGARKALTKGYEAGTGKPAPLVSSTQSSILQKVLWAAAIAAAVALAESLVWRALGDA